MDRAVVHAGEDCGAILRADKIHPVAICVCHAGERILVAEGHASKKDQIAENMIDHRAEDEEYCNNNKGD
jgi:hypothetical protein